jgi:hypothetical protein
MATAVGDAVLPEVFAIIVALVWVATSVNGSNP